MSSTDGLDEGLEGMLEEDEKAQIIADVERQRRISYVAEQFRYGVSHDNACTRIDCIQNLPYLALIDYEAALELASGIHGWHDEKRAADEALSAITSGHYLEKHGVENRNLQQTIEGRVKSIDKKNLPFDQLSFLIVARTSIYNNFDDLKASGTRSELAHFLRFFVADIDDPGLVLGPQTSEAFVRAYLGSRYIALIQNGSAQMRSTGDITAELTEMAKDPSIDYSALLRALEKGFAKDLAGMAECQKIHCHDNSAVALLGTGSFGAAFLMQNDHAQNRFFVYKVSKDSDSTATEILVNNNIINPHENIATMFGVVNVDYYGKSTKAIVQEYIRGKTLRQMLQDKGSIHTYQALQYISQILKGLQYLDSYDIRHRDLKPSNVMVTEDNLVKLIDFGLSSSAEVAGRPFLNRLYSPPEFKLGLEFPNSDIWSVGLILYEMTAGKYLFRACDDDKYDSVSIQKERISGIEEVWARLQKEMDEKYESRINEVPDCIRPILRKSLMVDARTRYHDFREMEEDIIKAIDSIWN